MAQIGATWDELNPGLRSYRPKASQGRAIAPNFGIAWPFPNVKAVDKQRLADVRRVTFAIQPPILHQHMEAIDPSRQTGYGAARRGRTPAPSPGGGLDCRRPPRHPAPACPPRVGGAQPLDQHRAGRFFDTYS